MNRSRITPIRQDQSIKIVTRDQIPVELFPDEPDVLDELGLTQQRKDMTKAQNEMIRLKNDIAIKLEYGDLFPEYASGNNDPFDFNSDENKISDSDYRKRLRSMENALKAPAISNPEFRSVTAKYLDDLIPVAKDKKLHMEQNIASLKAEYIQMQRKYTRKINESEQELRKFLNDLNDVTMKRFQFTDTGKATPGGLPVTELHDIGFWRRFSFTMTHSKYVIECLEWLRDQIGNWNKSQSDEEQREEQREMIRNRWKDNFRDGSGSAAPIGGIFSALFKRRS